jgi:hypothetical protein
MEATSTAPLTDLPEEPLAAPEPPPERLAWGFPIGCAVIAAAVFAASRVVAPPAPPPETYDFYAATPSFGDAASDEPPLPMPFLSAPVITPSYYAKPPSPSAPNARVRAGAISVSGRLPQGVVARILRQNHGRFRQCYVEGLRNNPNLTGRVTTRMVIGRDGAVSIAANGGSDMPDGSVVQCVVRAAQGLSFPRPEGGVVTVSYPILFAPG